MARKKKKQNRAATPSSPRGGADARDDARVDAEGAFVLPKAPKSSHKPFAAALEGITLAKPTTKGASSTGASSARPPSKDTSSKGAPGARRPPVTPTTGNRTDPPTSAGPVSYSYEDRVAFNQAFAGVAPLSSKGAAQRQPARQAAPARDPSATAPRPDDVDTDALARARLDALVAGGVRFDVRRDDEWIEVERVGENGRALRDLRSGRATPEAELDLHGKTGDEAERELVRFLREEAKRGRRIVRVVHGKGLHSDGGVGVLGERVVRAMIDGSAAPSVKAFMTAAVAAGGSGALLVRLAER